MRWQASTVAVALAGSWGVQSVADTRVEPSLTVSGSAGYSRNPYLEVGGGRGSGYTQLDVTPEISVRDELSQIVAVARYSRTDYFRGIGSTNGYGATVSGTRSFSSRLNGTVGLSYDSQVLGAVNNFALNPLVNAGALTAFGPGGTDSSIGTTTGVGTGTTTGPVADALNGSSTAFTPTVPVTPILGIIGGDVGLLGRRQRRELFAANAGLSYRPNAIDSWNFGADVARARYPGSLSLSGYRSYGAQASYRRPLSERSSIGLSVGANFVDYDIGGTVRSITPQLLYSTMLTERWSLDLTAGAGYVSGGGLRGRISASGSVALCRSGKRSRLCLTALQSPAATTGVGTFRSQTSVGANYSKQLTQRASVGLTVNYVRVPGGFVNFGTVGGTSIRTQSFLNGEGRVDYQLSRQFSLFGAVGGRRATGISGGIPTDIYGRAGITFRLARRP